MQCGRHRCAAQMPQVAWLADVHICCRIQMDLFHTDPQGHGSTTVPRGTHNRDVNIRTHFGLRLCSAANSSGAKSVQTPALLQYLKFGRLALGSPDKTLGRNSTSEI